MASIRSSINILAHHPQAGRPIEDMEIEFREWSIDFGNSGCIALYHFDGSTAVLLAVRHQSEAGNSPGPSTPVRHKINGGTIEIAFANQITA